MAKRTSRTTKHGKQAQLAFEAISIEGGLLSPEWLSRIAQLTAGSQTEADYRIPKGLNLRDEIGRYWRIAQAHWTDFTKSRDGKADPKLIAERFVTSLLRDSFDFKSLSAVEPPVISDRRYPIGHAAFDKRVPVVIAPAATGVDTLSPAFGDEGRRRSAFGLAQEYLNAAEGAVWGVATDGAILRIVRDNASLTRPAWIEADLARIFTEERYADFAALWLLLHESRFGREGQPATECALETWRSAGREEGTRAREYLRKGVEEALIALGQGFLSHPENGQLRAALQDGSLSTRDYFSQLLRLVYRLIFLLTVEERNLLHPPEASDAVKKLYSQGYSLRRVAERSVKRSAHDRFSDLWESVKVVLRGLGAGEPRLGLPALAGIFASSQCPALDFAQLENRALLLAIFKLAWLREGGALARVNWRDMGPEELGSVYESLLELVPQISSTSRQFSFASGDETKGNARKTSGSYYTPDSLVQVLLDSALEPVIADTIARNPANPVEALLGLSIVDPACGSGHFLLAAARRLAAHVARLQANGTPSANEYRHALRQVVGKCIYGVDANPMAVELCKIALWMEAVEPGKPLSFLDHHIRCGNSLLGATPELIEKGVPDDAFKPIQGDEKDACGLLKKRNSRERAGFGELFVKEDRDAFNRLRLAALAVENLSDDSVQEIEAKSAAFQGIRNDSDFEKANDLANLWCAAFLICKRLAYEPIPKKRQESGNRESPQGGLPQRLEQAGLFGETFASHAKTKIVMETSSPSSLADAIGVTTAHLRDFVKSGDVPASLKKEVSDLAEKYRFFHWHLVFPEVFARDGFNVVIGNPPWKMTEEDSRVEGETLSEEADDSVDKTDNFKRERAFYSRSGRFPLSAKNRLQLARLFAELFWMIRSPAGAAGMIIPSTITVNAFDRPLWSAWVNAGELTSVWDFVNLEKLFTEVDSRQKFCLISLKDPGRRSFKARCWLTNPIRLLSERDQILELSKDDLTTYSGPDLALPHFRGRKDLGLLSSAIARFGRLSTSREWAAEYVLLAATNDKDFVRQRRRSDTLNDVPEDERDAEWVPLYEGKMVGIYDHRLAHVIWKSGNAKRRAQEQTIPSAQKVDPSLRSIPLWKVPRALVASRDPSFAERQWDIALCDVTGSLNERTALASLVPLCFATHNLPLVRVCAGAPVESAMFLSVLASLPLDYFARLRVATNHLTEGIFFSLPIPDLEHMRQMSNQLFGSQKGMSDRVLELTFTAWDLQRFALVYGWHGPPFCWKDDRRLELRSELDAAFFHIYGISRSDAEYVIDTFPLIRENDEKAHGEYRTKRVILEIYDEMAEAIRTGKPYQTRLNPPPRRPPLLPPAESKMIPPTPNAPQNLITLAGLEVPASGNFHHLNRALTDRQIDAAFDEIVRQSDAIEVPTRIVREKRTIDGADCWASLVVFHRESPPSFLPESTLEEKIYGFTLFIEASVGGKWIIGIFKKSAVGIDEALEQFLEMPSRRAFSRAFGKGAQYQKLSLKRMTASKYELLASSYEALDLKTALPSLGITRSVPRSLRMRHAVHGSISITPGTFRLQKSGGRCGIDDLVALVILIAKELNRSKPNELLDVLPQEVEFSLKPKTLRPTGVLIELGTLLDKTDVEIRRTKNGIERAVSSKALLRIAGGALNAVTNGSNWDLKDEDGHIVGRLKESTASYGLQYLIHSSLKVVETSNGNKTTGLAAWVNSNDALRIVFSNPDYFYTAGQLYHRTGVENDIAIVRQAIQGSTHLNSAKSEKGKPKGTSTQFPAKSIFRIAEDSIYNRSEFVWCADLGDEWADYIVLNASGIIFAHCKHGKKAKLGASGYQEVIGQALKNLGNAKSPPEAFVKKLNMSASTDTWGSTNIKRLRSPNRTWQQFESELLKRISEPNFTREVHLVITMLSEQEFYAEARKQKKKPSFTQLVWLLSSFINSCRELGAMPKIYCKP